MTTESGESKTILGSSARYTLVMSDDEIGHSELGFMKRRPNEDPDDEDMRYQRFLVKRGFKSVRVHDGYASPATPASFVDRPSPHILVGGGHDGTKERSHWI
jgi:hypothetical protein